MKSVTGSGIAIITPFKPDFSIDYDALSGLIDFWINGGINYLVLMGTTGESVTLNASEKKELLNFCSDKIKGRVPLVLGVGGNDTENVLDTLRTYDFSKVSAILSVSPYYNKPNQNGIYHHFKEIASVSPVPVIVYNVPGRTGSNMTANTTLRLAREVENICGIKEASGNLEQITDIIRNAPSGFLTISGDDNLTLPILASGGDGVISVVANAYPSIFSKMVNDCLKGDFASALPAHLVMFPLVKLLFADGSPGGIKYVLHRKNLCGETVRKPLYPISTATREAIDICMKELDNFENVSA
jgi:4-hydroxy-tetrahydrodipicolinate synthase